MEQEKKKKKGKKRRIGRGWRDEVNNPYVKVDVKKLKVLPESYIYIYH